VQGVAISEAQRAAKSPDTLPRSPEDSPAAAAASVRTPPPSHEEYVAFVGSRFAAEPVDRAWNAGLDLTQKLSRSLPQGSSTRSLDCRSSMCRLETSHHGADAYRKFTESFTLLGGGTPLWTGPAVFQVTHQPARDGDELIAVAYLGRDSLPTLAQ
jgi:hypothetical protein